ncbi:putative methyltransferase-domain-containing protein [Calycina marina]|uniref:Methyltransferase-domain-containing protein n=1 Tax=Calycina marina TaxID=1763456 RepID=A0A9P7ZAU9_9HELO|nr:putative methyltransferase-domain-containing protein [Calycina marina]
MHYIRFLKPPRVVGGGSSSNLNAKITITTDLGESFLFSQVLLVTRLESENGENLDAGHEYLWKGQDGMRSIEVKIPLPQALLRSKRRFKLLIRPKHESYAVDDFAAALYSGEGNEGRVVAVRSMSIDDASRASAQQALVERVFGSGTSKSRIWEEKGESIARHIWYEHLGQLPSLRERLSHSNLRILELGAGCGIVGITLSTAIPSSQILLTDLPEASEILTHNLALLPQTRRKPTYQVLDWTEPLPPNVQSTIWDVVVVADCTYNPDVVPDLVATLGNIAAGNSNVLVLLAMKVRHESEKVFFELMNTSDWVVEEKAAVLLPVLGGEDEEIDIYVFKRG